MYVSGITLANGKNSVASKNSISKRKANYSQVALIPVSKGKDKINFGISSGREWRSMGNEVLRMCRSELLEMAEYFHKSSLTDIKGVCESSSIFGARKKQSEAYARLSSAVDEVIANKKNSSEAIRARMDERASKVEEEYSYPYDDNDDALNMWGSRGSIG